MPQRKYEGKFFKETIVFDQYDQSKPQTTDLIDYSNADYTNGIKSKPSMTGYFKNVAIVTWFSQCQQNVILLTTKAKCMAACVVTKLIWLQQLFYVVGKYKQNQHVCLHIDNPSAVKVTIYYFKLCHEIDVNRRRVI